MGTPHSPCIHCDANLPRSFFGYHALKAEDGTISWVACNKTPIPEVEQEKQTAEELKRVLPSKSSAETISDVVDALADAASIIKQMRHELWAYRNLETRVRAYRSLWTLKENGSEAQLGIKDMTELKCAGDLLLVLHALERDLERR